MPEGHSIHRLARQFNSVFSGHRLAASSPQGRFAAGAAQLDGHVLERAEAHGKQLFLHFDHDLILRVHLGLYGAWDFGGDESFRGASSIGAPRRVGERELNDDGGQGDAYAGPPEPVGAVRVRLVSAHGWADLRGPTACQVITAEEAAVVLAKLGPDPLSPAGEAQGDAAAEFVRRVRRKNSPVGALLMNQDVIAGVGNVYRAEVLFRQRLSPWRLGKALSAEAAGSLWDEIAAAMQDGVSEGRIITTAPAHRRDPGAGSGDAPVTVDDAHYVYKRTGLPCRICGTAIAQAEMGARKLYWCPNCQL